MGVDRRATPPGAAQYTPMQPTTATEDPEPMDSDLSRVNSMAALNGSTPDTERVKSHDRPPPNFFSQLRNRATLLVGLLIFQSCSSFILKRYSALLEEFPIIVYFLTMLVGAGGNAGNQAAVLVIRGLATGEVTVASQCRYLWSEVQMALCIASIMVFAGFGRVLLFGGDVRDAVAIASSLLAIVLISIVAGALLPLALHRAGFDPAHAGATIQVIMDLSGVLITCVVCSLLLAGGAAAAPPPPPPPAG